MTERDEFISWVQSVLRDAEIAVHNGDAGPRRAIWSLNDPVSVLGAWKNAIGQQDLNALFEHLAGSFSDCTSYEFELLEAEVLGDTAYTVGFEHTSASVDGAPRTYTLRATQIYRREDAAWKVAHRHGSDPPSSSRGGLAAQREVRYRCPRLTAASGHASIRHRVGTGRVRGETGTGRDHVETDRPALWVCPRCGARLVTRNMWHSCGHHTLDELFAGARPGVVEVARSYVDVLAALGDVQVIPQKSRLVVVARVRFAGLYPRKTGFLAAFSLHRWIDSPRIVKTADYGPRWRGHFVQVRQTIDLDDELRSWLRESHDTVGLQIDLPRPPQ